MTDNYDYATAREQAKLGPFMTCLMIFKTTIGVGIFTLPYSINRCGLVLGVLVASMTFYMVTYGIDLLLGLCDIIERRENRLLKDQAMQSYLKNGDDNNENGLKDVTPRREIEERKETLVNRLSDNLFTVEYELPQGAHYEIVTYHQVPNRIPGKLREITTLVSIVASVGMNLGFGVGNYVYLIKAFSEMFNLHDRVCSLIIYGITLILMILIIEPEKIKYVAMAVAAFIMASSLTLMGRNTYDIASGNYSTNLNYFVIKETGLVVGVSIFAFESISMIINVRRTTRDKQSMRRYTRWTFFFASVFFILLSLSFMFAFGKDKQHNIAFDYFKDTHKWIYVLKYFVSLNPLYLVPFSTISIIEVFEKVRPFSSMLRKGGNQEAALSGWRIFFIRLFLLTMVFLLTLIDIPIHIIFDIVGSLFGPFLGMLIPVLCWHSVVKTGTLRKIHDLVYVVLSVVFGVMGVRYAFQSHD